MKKGKKIQNKKAVDEHITKIPIEKIKPLFKRNYSQEDKDSLKASLNELGQLQNIVVRKDGDSYLCLFGWGRVLLLKELGKTYVDANGMTLCKVKLPNTSTPYEAPLCEEPGADKEPVPSDCCVKILGDTSAQILCPGSSYDLLIVEVVTTGPVGGIMIASVKHPDIPGGGVRLPICEPIDEAPEERV